MNKSDGGERIFILVEMEDYAEKITAERVRRVGGSFDFYEIGETIFDDDKNSRGKLFNLCGRMFVERGATHEIQNYFQKNSTRY